ncbi:MAG: histidine phosphatase family protein [Zestosphaera sp.]
MLLAFMRHGRAEPLRPGMSDDERRLTPEGRDEAVKVIQILDLRPKYVVSSIVKRALETAELASKLLGGVEILPRRELTPELFNLESLKNLLTNLDLSDGETVMLIGHSPSIEDVIQELLNGFRLYLPPASLACLEVKHPELSEASLKLYIRPDYIRGK